MAQGRENFQEIIERKKREGNYRVLSPDESLVDPVAFKEKMRDAHDDYVRMSNASIARAWNIIVF